MVIKCTQLTVIGGATIGDIHVKQCCERSQQNFFCFYITCDILGYVSHKWCKNSPFYLLRNFPGALGHDVFRAMMGPPLVLCPYAPVRSGAWAEWERGVKNTVERERSGERGLQNEAWVVSGNFDRSRSVHMLWLRVRAAFLSSIN